MNKDLELIQTNCKELLSKGDSNEMSNVIYDTLFGNTQFPQFDLNDCEWQEVNAKQNIIRFEYLGHTYELNISLVD